MWKGKKATWETYIFLEGDDLFENCSLLLSSSIVTQPVVGPLTAELLFIIWRLHSKDPLRLNQDVQI